MERFGAKRYAFEFQFDFGTDRLTSGTLVQLAFPSRAVRSTKSGMILVARCLVRLTEGGNNRHLGQSLNRNQRNVGSNEKKRLLTHICM